MPRAESAPQSPPSRRARTLIFARAPIAGQVKTRLIPALGAAGAAALHLRLLAHLVDSLSAAKLTPLELWVTPDTSHPCFASLAENDGVSLHIQRGADLGERLAAAAASGLTRADAVILIGTDCPQLSPRYLSRAIDQLDQHDAVLGPAMDGGYVLLGLKRPASHLFAEIPWGGDRVAELTRQRLGDLGWSWAELTALPDIDRPEDLRHLPRDLSPIHR
ncbi:glycosyltransferase [Thiorhodococcus mannitoliphagus]|uniref:Glycosyltransferase n=1 Tax=Thiorhodococcus mannitoliphagus TaxID=329406 RepID=A0A6P1DYG8_9GAMM|nr:TIGR04282 family arsenosugar biosynthesis glycosyltransferase [Thiorhodococcus mannitoliphagus]NEX21202.1 glycosyltransferase [Thiorhodococcus mannitoliphagus]